MQWGQGQTSMAQSRSLRVCAAEMQSRVRAVVSEQAGKPTMTSAMPLSRQARLTEASLEGWYTIRGCSQTQHSRQQGVCRNRPACQPQ